MLVSIQDGHQLDPVVSSGNEDPVVPVEVADTMDPFDPMKPRDPMEQSDPKDPAGPAIPMDPVVPVNPMDPVVTLDPPEPRDPQVIDNGNGPKIILPKIGLEARDLALVVNTSDPQSVQVGEYYAKARKIPSENIIRINFATREARISEGEFKGIRDQIIAGTPAHTQAYVITWLKPFRVDGMSITSAITFGYQEKYAKGGGSGCTMTGVTPLNGVDRLSSEEKFYYKVGG